MKRPIYKQPAQKKPRVGNPPENGILLAERPPWQLWAVNHVQFEWWLNGESEWVEVKLLSTEPTIGKANASFGMSHDRFAKCSDYAWVIASLGDMAEWLDEQREHLADQRTSASTSDDDGAADMADAVIDIVRNKGPIKYVELIQRVAELLNVRVGIARLEVGALVDQGEIIRERSGQNALYRLP